MTAYSEEELLEMEAIVRDDNGRLRFRAIGFDKGGFSNVDEET